MKKAIIGIAALSLATLGTYRVVRSHCEIPCGIYGDTLRIHAFYEDISTVEKSMNEIIRLSKEQTPNWNQLVRWVGNKEDHCNKIQEIVTQYFMTQRVKPPADPANAAAQEKYVKQLTSLHKMLLHAMQAKQTTDLAHIGHLRHLVAEFSGAYFSEADLKHIKAEHPEGK